MQPNYAPSDDQPDFLPAKIGLLMELRLGGILDTDVLSAIERTPRELFVPPPFRDRSYENIALPIGHGQTISQPLIVALMTQALEVDKRVKILEIGTGSGYQSAVLAKLARRIYTIERHRGLLEQAEKIFHQMNVHNITTKWGDGSLGWPEQVPFSRILITAASRTMPEALIDQLTPDGIMVIPIGNDQEDQDLVKLKRTDTGFTEEVICKVRFVPLLSGTSNPMTTAFSDYDDLYI